MPLPKLTLILGGAASGKSAFAESLVLQRAKDNPVYIATAQVFDKEMAEKVAKHRDMRGTGWHTIEVPLDLTTALATVRSGQPTLIDCATLWLTNVILGEHDVDAHTDALVQALAACKGPVTIVSNEVGQGIVPDNALSRKFRNAQGRLNQRLAAEADLVVAVMAGLPLALKGTLP
ncbi:bifunctional adenosylcobinamide kinase/adenosylcobinamide-phosphate guanylyltransferase [Roseobacter sp. CCS2]|uniref:bifunctional adenosylcobinamide kinase/adenosylcobinamide-phosphate guanylyltransferase n=1 Tax=Roseobacter sp. CCS2 TaxID=391593 RepID=UPI0000F3E3EE|nr:bifunctional adenosylcobinamide kinase/adenosylcobinamide-phosphate guanylyltransferase [Roseobacter sp. CCS2]EBA12298.1 Possible adenosyl cobinamide kinase/ cobinamide phosphate guanylyltransferase [Roseobacter sp. CCS2]